jgi:uncharacterized phage protein gp47/JayE
MKRGPDLTRWNRAGLERVRYVDADAITHLETLRERLAAAFPAPLWDAVQLGSAAAGAEESGAERLERMREQYAGPPGDWGWEIARALARAAHVLTEHVDAFANERFLGTATQWDYLRRLTAMIDYHPAPPSSGSTTLALLAPTAKQGGTVATGFQVKHAPEDGGAPVIFETLEDVDVHWSLNALRISGWDSNPRTFDPNDMISKKLWTLPKKHDVSVGQPGVLDVNGALQAVRVTKIEADAVAKTEHLQIFGARGRPALGATTLRLDPADTLSPRLGAGALVFANPHGRSVGEIVGWTKEGATGFARVSEADRYGLRLTGATPSGTDLTGEGVELYAPRKSNHAAYAANGNRWLFPLVAAMPTTTAFRMIAVTASGDPTGRILHSTDLKIKGSSLDEDDVRELLAADAGDADSLVFFEPGKDASVGVSKSSPAATVYRFDGAPGELRSGDALIAENAARATAAVEIASIREYEDSFEITLVAAPGGLTDVSRFHGPFKLALRPRGHDRNDRDAVTSGTFTLEIADAAAYDRLVVGRRMLVERETETEDVKPFATKLMQVGPKPADTPTPTRPALLTVRIDVTPADLAGYTKGDLILRGNAAAAGHGETMPVAPLGSGDAAAPSQAFTLEKDEASFVADPTLQAGVRAALEVRVDGRLWSEVSTLADAEAGDAVYVVRMTEAGRPRLTFGDGFNGRRLPTGRNNVSAIWRKGVGAAGNALAAGSLVKPVRPHPQVDKVRQPLVTSGGADMESADAIRQSAPAHLRALSRGVSLADLEHLARSQPGVWHARATEPLEETGREDLVDIAVVAADGVELGDVKGVLEKLYERLALPGIRVRVYDFDKVVLPITVRLRVDETAFVYETVETAVRRALAAAFALSGRPPGRPAYLAEAFEAVEGVAGVLNCDAEMFKGVEGPIRDDKLRPVRRAARSESDKVWGLWPTWRQAAFVPGESALTILRGEAAR